MAYQGYQFIFDGIPSQTYGLRIVSFESASYRYSGGSAMELITSKASRSLKTKILGSYPDKPLEFELEVICERELSITQATAIKSWLFGHFRYKKLQIFKDDLAGCYFNCILNNPEDININGYNGWKFTVICDAGGAWENPRTFHFAFESPDQGETVEYGETPDENQETTTTITIYNQSENNDYTYPSVSFVAQGNDGKASIKNLSDNEREFYFTGLSGGEAITIDGHTKIIKTSSEGVNRLPDFNKKFLRLVRGANQLEVSGISSLDITIENFRRLGG